MRAAPAALAALLIVLVVWSPAYSARQDPASIYAPDGLGQWLEDGRMEGVPVRVLHGPLRGLNGDEALLVVAPRLGYSSAEAGVLADFLAAGGRAVLADDTGSARQLLRGLPVDIQAGIYSTSYVRNPGFPLLNGTGLLADTVLSRPHVVAGSGEVLLRAHPLSWQDLDGDLAPDLDEPMGDWPVAMRLQVGAGQLIVVGDPDIFFQEVSRPTAQVLMQWLAQQSTIVVDEGHRASSDPVQATPVLAGARPVLALAAVAAVAAGVLMAGVELRVRRKAPRRRRALPDDPVLAELPDGS